MRALECGGEKQVQAIQDVVVEELFFFFLTGRIHKIKALRRGNCSSGHEAVHQMNEKKNSLANSFSFFPVPWNLMLSLFFFSFSHLNLSYLLLPLRAQSRSSL